MLHLACHHSEEIASWWDRLHCTVFLHGSDQVVPVARLSDLTVQNHGKMMDLFWICRTILIHFVGFRTECFASSHPHIGMTVTELDRRCVQKSPAVLWGFNSISLVSGLRLLHGGDGSGKRRLSQWIGQAVASNGSFEHVRTAEDTLIEQ